LPYVWSCFFYVLFCNLLGMFPWLGSPTGEINVTGALALVTFGVVLLCGSQESGFVGYWKSLVPHMDLPGALKLVLVPMIWLIELLGLLIKHGVLAVRLFANIMAGHTVIAVILGFIALAAHSWLYYLVLPTSLLGQVAIGMLELFVAFLQAYIFAFLSTLFISMAVNPH
jgi:F-type H+-transporting ATPase subunit a